MADDGSLDRVGFKLDSWKRQLIDLSRRNRLLNYRPTKTSTVEVVDELPGQILRQLLDGQSFEFDPRPETGALEPERGETEEGSAPEPETEGEVTRDLSRHRPLGDVTDAELSDRYTDNRLQTPHPNDKLKKKLTTIYRNAESSLEEQGVNTLFLALGMLEWYESPTSDESNEAPLILVPVSLSRDTAASPFRLSLRDEEPVLNPALMEKLRQDYSIVLAELPDFTADLDVGGLFRQIRNAISGLERWQVTQDVALGQFSFHKFLMFRDLERHADLFRDKELIRRICMEEEEDGEDSRIGLPADIADADLDEEMSPWETVQILDADSSQLRAMLAVRRGHDLVVEGPPGTGKSQTIANLIADQLAEGRSVLFVSEKMAALEVVKTRLDAAGLGSFCLELHSDKTKKTEFVRGIRRALDFSGNGEVDHEGELRRLKRLVAELRRYVEELHRPEPPTSWSPFEAIASLTEVEGAPRVPASVPDLMEMDVGAFEGALEDLRALQAALKEIGEPAEHPLRGFGLSHTTRRQQREVGELVARTAEAVAGLSDVASEAADTFGFRGPRTLGDVDLLLEGSQVLATSPGAELSILQNPRWNQLSQDVEDVLEIGQRYESRREHLKTRFVPDVIDAEVGELADEYEQLLKSGFLRWFKPTYWKVRSNARALLRSDYEPDDGEALLADLRDAEACRNDRTWVRDRDDLGRELFGDRWRGPGSDWTELEEFARWIVELRRYALDEVLGERGFQLAADASIDPGVADEQRTSVRTARDAARELLQDLVETCCLTPEVAEIGASPQTSISKAARRLDEIEESLDRLRAYSEYHAAREQCLTGLTADFLVRSEEHRLAPDDLVPAFRRLVFENWLDTVIEERPVLATFQTREHQRRVDEFQKLDEESKDIARQRAAHRLSQRRRAVLQGELRTELHLVQKEARKQRRIMPIRKLLRRAPNVLQLIKPCFMMSPLSVAKYLEPSVHQFDVLVFDEASQIPPADAVGSMIRAEQVIVVGDEKQLPPTSFFGVEMEEMEEVEDEELELLEDMESVLEQVAVSGIPSMRLKWHYRSEHESLIRFSNEEFYEDDPLYTFPHSKSDGAELGLQFEYLPDAVYEGRGENPAEARRVADAVVQHIRTEPDLTLGVGTFGMAQQRRIQDELDERRRANPDIEWFFNQTGERKFFVKNLENIQGDDRDVIFISVTYGPDEDGQVRRNFGPINKAGGWKRLNVITTRAKKRLRVFSSMRGDDIDPTGIKRGAQLLRAYLKYAETKRLPSSNASMGPPESPFERAVKREIERLGYKVVSQVGESRYRIDLGVIDPQEPGGYLCGIECDGATYHSTATVRDRDRIRQQVLETRGWVIHRVWSTDWFHDRLRQIERLQELIEASSGRRRDGDGSGPTAVHDTGLLDGTTTDSSGTSDMGRSTDPPGLESAEKIAIEDIAVPPYEVASLSRKGDPQAFYSIPPGRIAEVVAQVLDIEGPIAFRMLARRVASAWDLQQAGSTIRKRVESAVSFLERRDRAERRGHFVWPAGMDRPPVRSRDIPEVTFQARHLPPEEIEEAVRLLLRHRAPLLPQDIPSETARLLGFGRTGKNLKAAIDKAIEQLSDRGELAPTGIGIRLTAESDSTDAESEVYNSPPSPSEKEYLERQPDVVGRVSKSGQERARGRASLTQLGQAILDKLQEAYPNGLTAEELEDRFRDQGGPVGIPDKSEINGQLYGALRRWLQSEGETPPRWFIATQNTRGT